MFIVENILQTCRINLKNGVMAMRVIQQREREYGRDHGSNSKG